MQKSKNSVFKNNESRALNLFEFGIFNTKINSAIMIEFQPGSGKELTVIVTDSGLGGLNIFAESIKYLRSIKGPEKINLVYYNSLPVEDGGYNLIEDYAKKVNTFEAAIGGMIRHYSPDIVLIACNTLSVVFRDTKYSDSKTPLFYGIVETGAELIEEKLRANPGSSVIIMGTPTTIRGNQHRESLLGRGIEAGNILSRSLPDVESVIQRNPASSEINCMLKEFLGSLTPAGDKVFGALCCTHYEFSEPKFEETFRKLFGESEILNPNGYMLEKVFGRIGDDTEGNTLVIPKVVSKTRLRLPELESLGSLLEIKEPGISAILKNYEHRPELFEPPV